MTGRGLAMPATGRAIEAAARSDKPRLERPVTMRLRRDAPPIRRSPVPVARRFYQICLAMVADSLAVADLTSPQYGVLVYLSANLGEPGIDQSGLGARIGVD